MAQELTKKLQGFTLSAAERKGIELEERDVEGSKEECIRSLFGKVLGNKKVNFTGLKNTMNGIWPIDEPCALREIGFNKFQFIFQSQVDKKRVIQGKLWSFDNQFLVMREWKEGVDMKRENFSFIDMWIQVWDLPAHWISSEVGLKIGRLFPATKDVFIPETGSIKGRYLKIKVSVEIEKPLLRGTTLTLKGETHWVSFKYENLIGCCFYCGWIGHHERMCEERKFDIQNNNLREGRYGDWLKAEDLSGGFRSGRNIQTKAQLSPSKSTACSSSSEKIGSAGNKTRQVGENPSPIIAAVNSDSLSQSTKNGICSNYKRQEVGRSAIIISPEEVGNQLKKVEYHGQKTETENPLNDISNQSSSKGGQISTESTSRGKTWSRQVGRGIGRGRGKKIVGKENCIIWEKRNCDQIQSGRRLGGDLAEEGVMSKKMRTETNNKVKSCRIELLKWSCSKKLNSATQIEHLNSSLASLKNLDGDRDWDQWNSLKNELNQAYKERRGVLAKQ
ncbi:hypothetical protein DH2020_010067 [Rehmannia glutinosa]|uniref:CCHC-type domain-containing protein n=1 Tax=Rehmannia glutinosa TaxID=99300 RepID=A0ABR0X9Y5_REHGL